MDRREFLKKSILLIPLIMLFLVTPVLAMSVVLFEPENKAVFTTNPLNSASTLFPPGKVTLKS